MIRRLHKEIGAGIRQGELVQGWDGVGGYMHNMLSGETLEG